MPWRVTPYRLHLFCVICAICGCSSDAQGSRTDCRCVGRNLLVLSGVLKYLGGYSTDKMTRGPGGVLNYQGGFSTDFTSRWRATSRCPPTRSGRNSASPAGNSARERTKLRGTSVRRDTGENAEWRHCHNEQPLPRRAASAALATEPCFFNLSSCCDIAGSTCSSNYRAPERTYCLRPIRE